MGPGRKKGCKLILENPHGGILGKHVRTGIPPRAGTDARLQSSVWSSKPSTSSEKRLISGSSSSPRQQLGGWRRFRPVQISSENSRALVPQPRLSLRCALLLCLEPQGRSGLGLGGQVVSRG